MTPEVHAMSNPTTDLTGRAEPAGAAPSSAVSSSAVSSSAAPSSTGSSSAVSNSAGSSTVLSSVEGAAPELAGRLEPGLRMIGGEMRGWSDAGTPVISVGPSALHVIRHALPRRGQVLFVGPHDAELIDAVVQDGHTVELLLRSVPDARAARSRHAGTVAIQCGALDRIAGEYDAIIAVDGVNRSLTPDSTTVGWTAAVQTLHDAVRPGGPVILLVPNRFDLTRLSRVRTRHADYWPEHMSGPAEPPPGYAAVVDTLAAADLVVRRGFAVHPGDGDSAIIMTPEALRAPIAPTLVAAAYGAAGPSSVRQGTDRHGAGRSVPFGTGTDGIDDRSCIAEPRRLARDAVVHGLGFDLAPAWIVIARRGGDGPAGPGSHTDDDARTEPAAGVPVSVPTSIPDVAVSIPDIVVTASGTNFWAVPHVIERASDGSWSRRPVDTSTAGRMLGHLYRDPAALRGRVPIGELIEEPMLAACARHDHTGLRYLMRQYAQWLEIDTAPDGIAAGKVFATFDNVVQAPTGPEVFDPSWSVEFPVAAPVALVHVARRFAQRLLAGGHHHPWPSDASIDQIALTLVAMTGTSATSADLDAATALAVAIDVRGDDPGVDRQSAAAAYFAAADPAHGLGHREAARLAARRATELADAREQIAWLDETVRERDEQLSLAGRSMAKLRRSVTYRVGSLFTFPLHLLTKLARHSDR